MNAPVALFVYNRPDHTLKVLEALRANIDSDKTDIYIFSDGAKGDDPKVREVRSIINSFEGFRTKNVVLREQNLGLAESIISGVTQILSEHETVIVLEDDILTSPVFLKFMNESLARYKNSLEVISVNAYMYPIRGLPESFFLRNADCWGWATWRRGWEYFEKDSRKLLGMFTSSEQIREFNINDTYPYYEMLKAHAEKKNNSWAIRWYASAFLKNKLGLFVGKSLVKNIGLDSSGENCGDASHFSVEFSNHLPLFPDKIVVNQDARKAMAEFQNSIRHQSYLSRFQNYFKKIARKLEKHL